MRLEEELEDVAHYIFANPVRAGIVDEPTKYAFSGGEFYDLMFVGRPEGRPYVG